MHDRDLDNGSKQKKKKLNDWSEERFSTLKKYNQQCLRGCMQEGITIGLKDEL